MPNSIDEIRLRDVPIPILTGLDSLGTDSTGGEIIVQGGPKFRYSKEQTGAHIKGAEDTSASWIIDTAAYCFLLFSRFGRVERNQHRADLIALLSNLIATPIADPDTGVIRPGVAISAIRFLSLIPEGRPLPKIAPDHEGGVLLAWEDSDPELIVTLEENLVHFVVRPGTKSAEYFEDLEFSGTIPRELEEVLPT